MLVNFLTESVAPVGTYFRANNLARSLTASGCRVRIFGVDHDPDSRERNEIRDSVEYHITPSRKGQRFFGSQNHPLLAVERASQDYSSADVVHMFQPFLTTYLPWRREQSKVGRCWFDWDDLWTDGGLMGDRLRGGLRDRWAYYWINRIEHRAPRAATGVTVVSNWLAREAASRGARKTVRLYNGMWPRVPMAKASARERFGLSSRCIYLGFMGRTVSSTEFSWCLDGLRAAGRRNDVRLAICGPLDHLLSSIPHDLREKVDYLGALSATDCFDFAAALDFGLLPLEENLFNKSRFPIKLCDYLSVQTRVIASSVGECAGFRDIRGLIQAGTGHEHWISAVESSVQQFTRHDVPSVDPNEVRRILSWEGIGATVLAAYVSE